MDAISVAIPMFGGQLFHWCICQPHGMLPSPIIPRWRTDTGSSYNSATENDIKVVSAAAAMFYIGNMQTDIQDRDITASVDVMDINPFYQLTILTQRSMQSSNRKTS